MKELVSVLSCLVYVQLLVNGGRISSGVVAASAPIAATTSRLQNEGATFFDMANAIPKLSTLTGKIS